MSDLEARPTRIWLFEVARSAAVRRHYLYCAGCVQLGRRYDPELDPPGTIALRWFDPDGDWIAAGTLSGRLSRNIGRIELNAGSVDFVAEVPVAISRSAHEDQLSGSIRVCDSELATSELRLEPSLPFDLKLTRVGDRDGLRGVQIDRLNNGPDQRYVIFRRWLSIGGANGAQPCDLTIDSLEGVQFRLVEAAASDDLPDEAYGSGDRTEASRGRDDVIFELAEGSWQPFVGREIVTAPISLSLYHNAAIEWRTPEGELAATLRRATPDETKNPVPALVREARRSDADEGSVASVHMLGAVPRAAASGEAELASPLPTPDLFGPRRQRWLEDYQSTRTQILSEATSSRPFEPSSEPSFSPRRLLVAHRLLSHLRHGLAECLIHRITLLASRYQKQPSPEVTERLSQSLKGIAEAAVEVEQFSSEDLDGVAIRTLFEAATSRVTAAFAALEHATSELKRDEAYELTREGVGRIREASSQLLGALESYREEIDAQRRDVLAILQEAVELNRELAEEKAMSLRLELLRPVAEIALFVDPTDLLKAFVELLRNAVKYGEKGAEILIVVDPKSGGAAEVQVRIVQPIREDPTLARPSTSEGLPLVRDIIEAGHLGRFSAERSGERFIAEVVLPRRLRQV